MMNKAGKDLSYGVMPAMNHRGEPRLGSVSANMMLNVKCLDGGFVLHVGLTFNDSLRLDTLAVQAPVLGRE